MAATAKYKSGGAHDSDRKKSNIMLGKSILSAPNRDSTNLNQLKLAAAAAGNDGSGSLQAGGGLSKALFGGLAGAVGGGNQGGAGDAVAKSLMSHLNNYKHMFPTRAEIEQFHAQCKRIKDTFI